MLHELKISPGFCITLALMLFLVPLKWAFAIFFSALIHESGHILAIRLCNGKIRSASMDTFRTRIGIDPLSTKKELICAAAGPLAGLILVFAAPVFPRLAICALIHTMYNALPIYPMDGGRIVRCLTQLLFPYNTAKLCDRIETFSLLVLFLLAVWMCIQYELGFMPVAAVVVLTLRAYGRKIPCKGAEQAVQ